MKLKKISKLFVEITQVFSFIVYLNMEQECDQWGVVE